MKSCSESHAAEKKVFEEEGSRRLKESSIRRGRERKEEENDIDRDRCALVLDEIALSSPERKVQVSQKPMIGRGDVLERSNIPRIYAVLPKAATTAVCVAAFP